MRDFGFYGPPVHFRISKAVSEAAGSVAAVVAAAVSLVEPAVAAVTRSSTWKVNRARLQIKTDRIRILPSKKSIWIRTRFLTRLSKLQHSDPTLEKKEPLDLDQTPKSWIKLKIIEKRTKIFEKYLLLYKPLYEKRRN